MQLCFLGVTSRPVTRGASPPLENFSSPLEKFVGYILKLLHIVQKIWAPLRKLFALLVSQAGYGPVDICHKSQKFQHVQLSAKDGC